MLEKSSKLAAAGFTDVDTALSATAKTMNAYGMEGEEAMDKVQKVLMQTQNLGITTVGELGASLAQVTPTAAAFGVSFDQVGASLAVMTAQGTSTAQATTQLNSLIAELGKEGTTASKNLAKAAEGTEYAGMSFAQMMESGADLGTILGMISEQADKDEVSMVDMFSSIEAGKAALSIFSQEGETFKKDLGEMSTSADVVGEAYEKVQDTADEDIPAEPCDGCFPVGGAGYERRLGHRIRCHRQDDKGAAGRRFQKPCAGGGQDRRGADH